MRCGYCQVSETEVGSELTFDHFQPRSLGGSDTADNLVYACHACNEFKGEYYGSDEGTRLLHPLRDDLTLHLRLGANGNLEGITAVGNRYIERLQLNRQPLVLYRQNQGRAEQSMTRYEAINGRLEEIMTRIERVEEQIHAHRGRPT